MNWVINGVPAQVPSTHQPWFYATQSENTAVQCGYTNLIDAQLHSSMRLTSGCLLHMQLSWLPVLSNVAPPSLHRKAATDNMLQIIEAHPNWPVYADVFKHPPPRLAPRRQTWSDMTSVDTITQWREGWPSASVVNYTIVTDPTIRQPGFDLPRHTWSPMNRFRAGKGPCRANLHKWGLAQSPSCDCGQPQTMNRIVDTCLMPINKIWRWTESTPRSGWRRRHMAGIYSDCSTRDINK